MPNMDSRTTPAPRTARAERLVERMLAAVRADVTTYTVRRLLERRPDLIPPGRLPVMVPHDEDCRYSLDRLALVAWAAHHADKAVEVNVPTALHADASWAEIAEALHLTKADARERFGWLAPEEMTAEPADPRHVELLRGRVPPELRGRLNAVSQVLGEHGPAVADAMRQLGCLRRRRRSLTSSWTRSGPGSAGGSVENRRRDPRLASRHPHPNRRKVGHCEACCWKPVEGCGLAVEHRLAAARRGRVPMGARPLGRGLGRARRDLRPVRHLGRRAPLRVPRRAGCLADGMAVDGGRRGGLPSRRCGARRCRWCPARGRPRRWVRSQHEQA